MQKMLQIMRMPFQKALIERPRIVIWFLADTLHMLVFPFLWLTVYGSRDMLHGFTQADIVTYFIIVIIIKVIAVSHSDDVVIQAIQKGDMNTHLLRPVSHQLYTFFHELGYKFFYGSLIIPFLLIFVVFFPSYLIIPDQIITWFLALLAVAIGFIISETIAFSIGATAFWFTDARPLRRLMYFLGIVFSGRLAPLEFFPDKLRAIAEVLPFQFWAAFPANIYMEHLTTIEVARGFLLAGFWIVLLFALSRILWNRGVKRYEGIGI